MTREAQRTRLWLRSYDGADSRHTHGFHQVVLPVAGAMEIEVGDVGGRVADGTGVVIPIGTAHRFRAGGENRFVIADFPCDLHTATGLSAAALRRAAAAPFFPVDAALRHLVLYLAQDAGGGAVDPGTAQYAGGLLMHALGRRLSNVGEPLPRPVVRAIELIIRDYAEPITVADLGRAAGLSVSRLHESFRRATGRTPAEYLCDVRLDRAEDLLRTTDLPIAEIALLTGYSDQTALTRSLRRRRGTTPAAVRRSH
ncbi:MAG TPA: AraC family transcriptional regulator [Alphaproteobacteria bacterium]|nr:AraC family transcriptional regulator [Alphaproteobacteria bacterium]